jgi:hypothetical protein
MTPEICCNCLSKEEEDTINFIAFFGLWRNYRFSDYQGKNSFSNRRHAPVGGNNRHPDISGQGIAVLSSSGPLRPLRLLCARCGKASGIEGIFRVQSVLPQRAQRSRNERHDNAKEKHTYYVLRTTYYVIRFSLPLPHALFFQKPHSGASFAKAKTLLRLPGAMP